MHRIPSLFALVLLAACSNPAIDHCTKETTDKLLSECKASSRFDVSGDCFALAGGRDLYVAGGYAVKACQAGEEGVFEDCLVKHPTECVSQDEAVQKQLRVTCSAIEGNPHGRTEDCEKVCSDQRATCEAACSKTDAQACLDCSAACGIKQADCVHACPERTG